MNDMSSAVDIPQIDLPDTPPRPLTKDVILDPPISMGTKDFTVLHLEEPTAQQLFKAQAEFNTHQGSQGNTAFMVTLISLVSETPRQVVDKLRLTQLGECSRFLGSFIEHGL